MRRAQTTIEETPRELIDDPIAWFFLEHERHRRFCRLMAETAADETFDPETLTYLLDFLRNELARHIIDEEEDLFPLLRRRALREDHIGDALSRLTGEHRADAALAHAVRERLEACLAGRTAPGAVPVARRTLEAFASQELGHLALENAVVLPIARLRLTAGDLKRLSRGIAARRGLVHQPS